MNVVVHGKKAVVEEGLPKYIFILASTHCSRPCNLETPLWMGDP